MSITLVLSELAEHSEYEVVGGSKVVGGVDSKLEGWEEVIHLHKFRRHLA